MMRTAVFALIAVSAMLALVHPVSAVERSEVPAKLKWNLTALYPSEAAWQSAKTAIAKRIPDMEKFQGHLGDSPQALLGALDAMMKLSRDVSQLYNYASMLADEDQRISRHIAMRE